MNIIRIKLLFLLVIFSSCLKANGIEVLVRDLKTDQGVESKIKIFTNGKYASFGITDMCGNRVYKSYICKPGDIFIAEPIDDMHQHSLPKTCEDTVWLEVEVDERSLLNFSYVTFYQVKVKDKKIIQYAIKWLASPYTHHNYIKESMGSASSAYYAKNDCVTDIKLRIDREVMKYYKNTPRSLKLDDDIFNDNARLKPNRVETRYKSISGVCKTVHSSLKSEVKHNRKILQSNLYRHIEIEKKRLIETITGLESIETITMNSCDADT